MASPQAPAVPPRPARNQAKGDTPEIPPRPAGRMNRSVSPAPQRFAQSPLTDSFLAKGSKTLRFEDEGERTESPERPRSVIIPSIGEEGIEYAAIPDEAEKHTVGDEIKLQAPKPKLAASTAKDRISNVTRTDSERAASFGIGRPGSHEPSLRKKSSNLSQMSGTDFPEEKEGIPEFGQRIPLLAYAGDVQAPSPAPGSADGLKPRHHTRKASARGFEDLPEDSYGLHGHGKAPKDKLDKAYYEKHPEIAQREKLLQRHEHDRANDFALTSDELNKLVRNTASRNEDHRDGIPAEDIGYEAHVEYASRMSRPTSAVPPKGSDDEAVEELSGGIQIKRDDMDRPTSHSEEEIPDNYNAPILAPDEVARDPQTYEQAPAVIPPQERSGSSEEPKSRSASGPGSVHVPALEVESTPLEDVNEYEPLFPDDEKDSKATKLQQGGQPKQRFPSKDVWEDAPSSVHATTEVSGPQPPEDDESSMENRRAGDARKKEILQIAYDQNKPRSWVEKQLKMSDGTSQDTQRRFPSRDVWEDTPDSLQLKTTVSGPQQDEADELESPIEAAKPQVPARPTRRGTDDDPTEAEKPTVSDRTKSKPAVPDKPKPAVPARSVGGKIAALQAGFMADLNKRLQAGPQPSKKDESPSEDLAEENEKTPLADARKSRARGPQRRAPVAPKSPGSTVVETPSLSFSMPQTVWSIKPWAGAVSVDSQDESAGEEPKSLATNMAVEPVIEANVETLEASET